jgi:hypothetical protein
MLMSRAVVSFALLCVAATLTPSFAEESPPKGSELSGFKAGAAAVEAFVKGLRDGDIEAVMATVDVPWFHDGKRIIESQDALRELLSEPIREREFSTLNAEITEVQQFKSLRDKASGTSGELLKKVAGDDDLIFLMKTTVGTKSDTLMLLVRVNGDEAKIIGLRD